MGPDELDDFSAGGSPTEFLEEMQEDLKDIERLPDEHVADETHLRYRASAEPDETPDMTAEVLLWLRREDLLPHKVEVYLDGEGFTLDAAYEFLEYGEQAVAPARPTDALPWRDHELPDAPCTGDAFEACLAPASGLDAIAQASCGGEGRRVCLAPLGNVSAELVRHLAQHYQDVYGLSVAVLAPSAVPAEAADNLRQQVDAPALIDYMAALFPDAYADPQAVLIGITPLDLYNSTSHYRYVFGVKRTAADPKAVVSTFRMDPETYSEPPDRELLFARVRKLVTKYIGLLYYDLPASDDPASPMFDSILGPSDLDAMEEPLPVAAQR
jgi:predicted Zn-dependent protease